jgi:glycosyltransferase involved in cell wall biosynthesis
VTIEQSGDVPISVLVLTFNEEKNIGDCLQSCAGWAGEVIVVDSGSTDRTVTIAEQHGTRVVEHPFETYARQRNWAQEHISLAYQWVLHLDADERITPELRDSIRKFFARGDDARYNGAMFPRRTVFLGKWIRHGGHYPVFHMRLFRKDRGRCEDRIYHQHFLVPSPVTRLSGDMIDTVASDLDSFSLRHIRWAGEEAKELMAGTATGREQLTPSLTSTPMGRRRWLRNRLYARMPLFVRAFAYFLYRYIIRRGFLDGKEGLIFHFLQGCWAQFYIDAKVWERQQESIPPDGGTQEFSC